MKINLYLGLFLIIITALTACDDIIEKNIQGQKVALVVPGNAITISNSTVNFVWEQVKGATSYKLQVCRPSFSAIQELPLDTNVSGTNFITTLKPGNYEWRVKAFNSTSETPYTTYSFKIDSTSSLQSQTLLLLSPVNGFISSQFSQQLKWSKIAIADNYRLEIYLNNNRIDSKPNITADTLTYNFSVDGTYVWKVRAENSTSVSQYSSNTIVIDTKAPNAPTLIAPISANVVKKDFKLQWSRGATSGSLIHDSVYIYSDSLNKSLIKGLFTADTSYSNANADTASYISSKAYFWKVRSIDAAGNKSPYSTLGKFKIQ